MCSHIEMSDLYNVLGVERDATTEEIRRAYKDMSKLAHPDREGGSKEKFQKIQEAAEVLSDDNRRRMYDMTGSVNEGQGGGPMGGMAAGGIPFQFMGGMGPFGMPGVSFDMGDIFGQMFGGGGPMRRQRADRGPNKHHDIGLRMSDFYKGHEINLRFNQARRCLPCSGGGAESTEQCGQCKGAGFRNIMRQIGPGMIAQTRAACDGCNGEGKRTMRVCRHCQGKRMIEKDKQLDIKITPGMRDGEQLVFAGECSDSADYENPGDVVLTLRRSGTDEYEWKGDDLWLRRTVTFAESILGFSVVLSDHPNGLSPSFSWRGGPLIHGAVLQMTSMGMPRKGGGFGTLYLQIMVTPPEVRAWTPEEAATLQSVLGGESAAMMDSGNKLLLSSKESILVVPK